MPRQMKPKHIFIIIIIVALLIHTAGATLITSGGVLIEENGITLGYSGPVSVNSTTTNTVITTGNSVITQEQSSGTYIITVNVLDTNSNTTSITEYTIFSGASTQFATQVILNSTGETIESNIFTVQTYGGTTVGWSWNYSIVNTTLSCMTHTGFTIYTGTTKTMNISGNGYDTSITNFSGTILINNYNSSISNMTAIVNGRIYAGALGTFTIATMNVSGTITGTYFSYDYFSAGSNGGGDFITGVFGGNSFTGSYTSETINSITMQGTTIINSDVINTINNNTIIVGAGRNTFTLIFDTYVQTQFLNELDVFYVSPVNSIEKTTTFMPALISIMHASADITSIESITGNTIYIAGTLYWGTPSIGPPAAVYPAWIPPNDVQVPDYQGLVDGNIFPLGITNTIVYVTIPLAGATSSTTSTTTSGAFTTNYSTYTLIDTIAIPLVTYTTPFVTTTITSNGTSYIYTGGTYNAGAAITSYYYTQYPSGAPGFTTIIRYFTLQGASQSVIEHVNFTNTSSTTTLLVYSKFSSNNGVITTLCATLISNTTINNQYYGVMIQSKASTSNGNYYDVLMSMTESGTVFTNVVTKIVATNGVVMSMVKTSYGSINAGNWRVWTEVSRLMISGAYTVTVQFYGSSITKTFEWLTIQRSNTIYGPITAIYSSQTAIFNSNTIMYSGLTYIFNSVATEPFTNLTERDLPFTDTLTTSAFGIHGMPAFIVNSITSSTGPVYAINGRVVTAVKTYYVDGTIIYPSVPRINTYGAVKVYSRLLRHFPSTGAYKVVLTPIVPPATPAAFTPTSTNGMYAFPINSVITITINELFDISSRLTGVGGNTFIEYFNSPYNFAITLNIGHTIFQVYQQVYTMGIITRQTLTVSYGTLLNTLYTFKGTWPYLQPVFTYTIKPTNTTLSAYYSQIITVITNKLGSISTSTTITTSYVTVKTFNASQPMLLYALASGTILTEYYIPSGSPVIFYVTVTIIATIEGVPQSIGYTTSAPSFLQASVNRVLSLLFYIVVVTIFVGLLLCLWRHVIACNTPECHAKFKKCLIRIFEAVIIIYVVPHVIDWLLGIL